MEALLAPGQVIELLVGRTLHLPFDVLVAGYRRVSLVQRLCSDFTSVIDSHQAGGMPFLAIIELGIDDVRGRICAGGAACWRGNRAQGVAGACQKFVEGRELSFIHVTNYSEATCLTGILARLF